MLGIIIGATLYFNESVVVKREVMSSLTVKDSLLQRGERKVKEDTVIIDGKIHRFVTVKTPITRYHL